MPYSDPALRPWIARELTSRMGALGLGAPGIVDVGAGAGTARDFYDPMFPGARWAAIEVWEPYVALFGLLARYDEVIVADVREAALPPASLYLFGDVAEHMPAADAVQVWDRARLVCGWLVLALPVLPFPQGAVDGNPFEEHRHQWDMPSVLDSFAGIVASAGPVPGSTVGAFIAEGAR